MEGIFPPATQSPVLPAAASERYFLQKRVEHHRTAHDDGAHEKNCVNAMHERGADVGEQHLQQLRAAGVAAESGFELRADLRQQQRPSSTASVANPIAWPTRPLHPA